MPTTPFTKRPINARFWYRHEEGFAPVRITLPPWSTITFSRIYSERTIEWHRVLSMYHLGDCLFVHEVTLEYEWYEASAYSEVYEYPLNGFSREATSFAPFQWFALITPSRTKRSLRANALWERARALREHYAGEDAKADLADYVERVWELLVPAIPSPKGGRVEATK